MTTYLGQVENGTNAEQEGFIERSSTLYDLSVRINEMIIEYEKEHKVKIIANGQVGEHYPLAYPNEPKIALFEIL